MWLAGTASVLIGISLGAAVALVGQAGPSDAEVAQGCQYLIDLSRPNHLFTTYYPDVVVTPQDDGTWNVTGTVRSYTSLAKAETVPYLCRNLSMDDAGVWSVPQPKVP